MYEITSIIGIGVSFIGLILPMFAIFFPKVVSVGIFRNFTAKRFFLLFTGLLFIFFGHFSGNDSGILLFLGSWVLIFLLSILINPTIMFRALTNPQHFPGDSPAVKIKEDDLIIGYVSDSGKAYAWPLKEMVKTRHLVNDNIEGKPLLVTYCPLCKSGLLVNPVVNGTTLTFKVAGLYRGNMVMMDQQTKTIWQQATGKAINGKLTGIELELLPYEIITWKGWYQEHPGTTIAWESAKNPGSRIQHAILKKMFESSKIPRFPGKTKLGKELGLQVEICGIKIGSQKKAYPLTVLQQKNVIHDVIGSEEIQIVYSPETRGIKAFLVKNDGKQPLAVERHFWFAWKEFYPETLLFTGTPG